MKVHGKLEVTSPINPVVLFDYETLLRVQYLVKQQAEECQWFHRVDRIEENGTVAYYLHDLFIPNQIVGKTDVESDPASIQEMWQQIKKERGFKTTRELTPLIQNTSCWCHSHHNMTVNPSATDKQQWLEQKKLATSNGDQPQIMLILNKKNECYSKVYDPKYNLEFERVPVHTQNPISFADIDEIIKTRFRAMPKVNTVKDVKSIIPPRYVSVTSQAPRKISNNGHPINCICETCKTIDHAASCECDQCGKSKKKITSVPTEWKQNIYTGIKTTTQNLTPSKKNLHSVSRMDSSSSTSSFFTSLDAKGKNVLRKLVSKLNVEPKQSLRKKIAQKIVDELKLHLERQDMLPLRFFINVHPNIIDIFRLHHYYFKTDGDDKPPLNDKSTYEKLVKTLVGLDYVPPHYLIECVESVMKCGATSEINDLDHIIHTHVRDFYQRFSPMETK